MPVASKQHKETCQKSLMDSPLIWQHTTSAKTIAIGRAPVKSREMYYEGRTDGVNAEGADPTNVLKKSRAPYRPAITRLTKLGDGAGAITL
jgi:hypothetical protein